MQASINCLINSAKLPLSIIIVGIGNDDFSNMEVLDGDDGLFNDAGQKAQRDLVQFVSFKKFESNQELLAAAVLEEIPDQLVEYMSMVGIKPSGRTIDEVLAQGMKLPEGRKVTEVEVEMRREETRFNTMGTINGSMEW